MSYGSSSEMMGSGSDEDVVVSGGSETDYGGEPVVSTDGSDQSQGSGHNGASRKLDVRLVLLAVLAGIVGVVCVAIATYQAYRNHRLQSRLAQPMARSVSWYIWSYVVPLVGAVLSFVLLVFLGATAWRGDFTVRDEIGYSIDYVHKPIARKMKELKNMADFLVENDKIDELGRQELEGQGNRLEALDVATKGALGECPNLRCAHEYVENTFMPEYEQTIDRFRVIHRRSYKGQKAKEKMHFEAHREEIMNNLEAEVNDEYYGMYGGQEDSEPPQDPTSLTDTLNNALADAIGWWYAK